MKHTLNKKGLENETLVLLILASVAVIFSVFYFNKGIGEASNRSVEVTACKASVDRNARLHINGIEFPASLNCPARNIKITKADDEAAQDSAKKLIADAMYDCWYMYGQGRLNLFKDEATFCSVCAFVNIEATEPVKGLPAYLLTEQSPDKSGKLYSDYLASYKTSKAEQVLGAIKDTPLLDRASEAELKGKSNYAIVFVYAKGKDELEKLANHLFAQTTAGQTGLIIGVGAGTVAGTTAALTLLSFGIAAGPVGWAALGVGVSVLAIAEAVSFFASPDNVPEWAALTALREWNPSETQNILRDDFGCTYFPTKLE